MPTSASLSVHAKGKVEENQTCIANKIYVFGDAGIDTTIVYNITFICFFPTSQSYEGEVILFNSAGSIGLDGIAFCKFKIWC